MLECALENIQDTDLPKLSEISVWEKEQIENLASNLKTLTAEQTEKVIANQFLTKLLTRSPKLLEYALENIKEENLPKLSYVTIWNKEQIENLVSNLDKLTAEQVDKAISTYSITQRYDLIKYQLALDEAKKISLLYLGEYKEIGGVIVTDPNAAQEWAESKIVGEDVYSADQL